MYYAEDSFSNREGDGLLAKFILSTGNETQETIVSKILNWESKTTYFRT